MGSQDQTNRKTYNDPTGKVEQYSLEYMRSLKSSAPEEMLRLWHAGHFTEAIAEEGARKASERTYHRSKSASAESTQLWIEHIESEND